VFDFVVPVVGGSDQRRGAGIVCLVDGGVGGKQQLHAVAVAFTAGGEQRCGAVVVCLVDGGVGSEQ